jgi:hypothetical protein
MRALPLAVALVLAITGAGSVGVLGTQMDGKPNACVGTVIEEPDRSTLVSIQGTRVTAEGVEKTNALLVSFAPNGSFRWVQNSTANGRWWAYDVDPLADGDLLYATTEPGISVVGAFDPEAGEYEWLTRFDGDPDDATTPLVTDAHDVDLVDEHELLIADKGQGHERLLAYNRTSDRVAWEWRFEDHPESVPRSGGGPPDDWTHVNDVEQVGDHLVMASVRNFDQVVFVNRTTDEVALTLGSDDEYGVLHEQHNPDHSWGPDGEHTVLVADSENDRVVEYRYREAIEEWELVWSVGGFDEPRDADRLPNGNTLVADRRGHRVVEITPAGEAVWEVYTPFEPYDVERDPVDESNGPTMADLSRSGQANLSGDAGFTTAEIERCARDLFAFARPRDDGPAATQSTTTSDQVGSVVEHTQVDDRNDDTSGFPAPLVAVGAAVFAALLAARVVYWRR